MFYVCDFPGAKVFAIDFVEAMLLSVSTASLLTLLTIDG
jgi:hypothetical protein